MTMVTMKRHEMWRHRYRHTRDLDHLSTEELSERLHDCINNIRIRTVRGKLGVRLPTDKVGEKWTILFTEVLEECSLRGYEYPGPITIEKYRSALDHAFDPIPDMDSAIEKHGLNSRPYLLKFGDHRWLTASIERGVFRISSASYYDSDELNHARQDTELHRFVKPKPRSRVSQLSGCNGELTRISAPSDYYLFSMAERYSSRLFGDFASTSCLVIYEPKIFLARLQRAITQRLPGWQTQVTRVIYYDPVRVEPDDIVVPKYKPFRHAYQEEIRLLSLPQKAENQLQPFEIELGPLYDCATLVDLTTHPAAVLPHDPYDDPIQMFGNITKDLTMVNHLPEAAKVQGIALNKSAPRHEDWYFQIQYTDVADKWHEVKMPMLDGLYLLNLLRTAEQEQHLGLWNRV